MKRIVVLLAEPRTGTSLINHRMKIYHPLIDLQEFFHNGKTVSDLLEIYNTCHTSVFLKVLSNQLGVDNIKQLMLLPFVEVIYLTRDDKLATYVSWQKAIHHNLWHENNTSNFKITLDLENYTQWLDASKAWHTSIQEILVNKNVLTLNYEQHLENFQQEWFLETMDNWFSHIGLTFRKVPLVKDFGFRQNILPIEYSIENWNEVVGRIPK